MLSVELITSTVTKGGIAMFNKTQVLRLRGIVRRAAKDAPTTDQRRRVNYVLAEYVGEDGHDYRKAFRSYGEPIVPPTGTHDHLNSLAEQY